MSIVYETDPISDVLTFSSALTGVAAGGYSVPSGAIDNTYAGGKNRLTGALLLTFSTALTAGTGAPFITLFPLLLADGTTYPNPPGNAAAAPAPNARQFVRQLVASGVYSALLFEGIDLDPALYAFLLYNNSGVAWSGGGTITATLYRHGIQIV